MNKFIVIIRPEFMLFCKDACQAAALNHLLFRIAGKSKDAPQEKIISGDILWYAKNEQIVEEMSNAWGLCKVRQEVNRLIKIGLIGRKNNPEWGADRTKHFCFGELQCRKFLAFCEVHQICVVHLELPNEVKHLIYSSNANDKSIKCICSIHQMELMEVSNANDKYIEAIPKEIPTEDRHTIDDIKEEDTIVATSLQEDRNAPANVYHFEEEKKRITNGRIPIVNASHSQVDIGNDDFADRPTEKRPAVKIGGNDETYQLRPAPTHSDPDTLNATHNSGMYHDRQIATQQKPDAGMPLASGNEVANVQASIGSPADAAQRTALPQGGAVQASIPKRPRGKKVTQADEPVPMPKSDPKEVQRRVNEHRGYALEEKVEIIRERQAIKTWSNLHEIGDFDTVMAKLRKDPYWGKDENYYRIGGVILLRETPKALANGKHSAAPDTTSSVANFDDYVGNGAEERAARRQLYQEMKARGELIS